MMRYKQFKKLFEKLESEREPEIEIIFKHKENSYMIIKYPDFITFQRCGNVKNQSGEYKFSSLEELYNAKIIDGICLKEDWDKINDIILDASYSVVEDKLELEEMYDIKL